MIKSLAYYFAVAVLCTPHFAIPQSPNFLGTLGGTMVTEAGQSGIQLSLTREGSDWRATMKLRAQGDGFRRGGAHKASPWNLGKAE